MNFLVRALENVLNDHNVYIKFSGMVNKGRIWGFIHRILEKPFGGETYPRIFLES
jgi:hypothetical protein